MLNNVKGMAKVFKSSFPLDAEAALENIAEPSKQSLTLEQAALVQLNKALI